MAKKRKKRRTYRGPGKWVQFILVRGLVGFLQLLPIGVNYRLGRILGWLGWKLMRHRRATVIKNLEIVQAHMRAQPELSAEEDPIEQQGLEVFQRAGVNLLCGFNLGRMHADALRSRIQVEGLELLSEVVAAGQGAILVMSHMGPWEALSNMNGYYADLGINTQFGAVYRAFNNAYTNAWFVGEREASGTRMFPSRNNFYAPSDFVRSGGILGVLSDQRASGGEEIEFFGRKVRATPLPGLLHLRTKAPMLAISVCTTGKARWKIEFFRMESVIGQDGVDRKQLAAICGRAAEHALSRSVYDGFWFHNRFR